MAIPTTASEATEQMFALVGRCITRWSFVEETLCNLFSICTSPCLARPEGGIEYLDSHVSLTVFYSVENFRAKLGLVDAAVTSRISVSQADPELFATWSRLKDKTRKLSMKRNRLAHWTVLPAYNFEGLHPARLVPPIGSPGYYRATGLNPGADTLHPLHLQHLERAFWLIDDKLRQFAFNLACQEELFDRSVRLMVRQMESLDRLDPTRAARLRRELSSPE